jgi:cytochrome c
MRHLGKRIPVKLIGLIVCALVAFGVGCSDPDRAILTRLGEIDGERFLQGRRAANGCWVCHDLAGTVKKVGPSLLGLYGRRSGMAPEYRGSNAMIGASIVWDDRSLSLFLNNPSGFVPGNRMVSPGIGNRRELADILFYLRHVTRPGARSPDGAGLR